MATHSLRSGRTGQNSGLRHAFIPLLAEEGNKSTQLPNATPALSLFLPFRAMKHYPCTHAVQNRKQSMRRTTMNWSQFQRRTSLALCFLALAAIAYGQAQQGAQFEPQVGQAGKDVVWVPTPQELVNKML